jgi:hypothetical protein
MKTKIAVLLAALVVGVSTPVAAQQLPEGCRKVSEGKYTCARSERVEAECTPFQLPEGKKGIEVGVFLPIAKIKHLTQDMPEREFRVNYKMFVTMPVADAVNHSKPGRDKYGVRGAAQSCEYKHGGQVIRSGVQFHVEAMQPKTHGSDYFVSTLYVPKTGVEVETFFQGVKYVGRWGTFRRPDGKNAPVVYLEPQR